MLRSSIAFLLLLAAALCVPGCGSRMEDVACDCAQPGVASLQLSEPGQVGVTGPCSLGTCREGAAGSSGAASGPCVLYQVTANGQGVCTFSATFGSGKSASTTITFAQTSDSCCSGVYPDADTRTLSPPG